MGSKHIFTDNSMPDPLDVRSEVRDGALNIDIETNSTFGFEGTEDQDWENVEQHKLPEPAGATYLTLGGLDAEDKLSFDPDGATGPQNITVSCDGDWSLTIDHADIITDITSGSGNGVVVVDIVPGGFAEPLGFITFTAGALTAIAQINRSA